MEPLSQPPKPCWRPGICLGPPAPLREPRQGDQRAEPEREAGLQGGHGNLATRHSKEGGFLLRLVPAPVQNQGRKGEGAGGEPSRRQAGASTLRSAVAVVKLMSPEKHDGAVKTAAGPAFLHSGEAQKGAGTSPGLLLSFLLSALKLSSSSIRARRGVQRF